VGASIAYFDPARRFHIGPEALYSGTVIGGDARRGYTSLEVLVGGLYNIAHQVLIGAAGGIGLLREPGTPDFRFLFRLAYAPLSQDRDRDGISDENDRCPSDPEDKDQYQDSDGCPDPDNDQDGIPDAMDKCPNDIEDKDGFEDEDGCSEPDNDKDGLSDLRDPCPTEAEDKDGFKDDDGCPDPDNDRDGLPDLQDPCPTEAEDKDGFKDDDGCPDPDNDRDGLPDAQDNCPDEPGPASNHGCKGRQLARLREGRIDILDSVYFKTDQDVIARRSYPLLDNVARILQSHPDLRVRVEGHTDNQGRPEHNKELSRRRAESVVRFLTSRGVDAQRLEAEGYGPTQPIADNRTRQGRAKNRRVVFTIIGDASGIRREDAGPGADTVDR
jgi:OOP family OmpA-OmpF porin